MRFFDYVYYSIYRYILTTPDRKAADAWPIVIMAWTLWIHALIAYQLFALVVSGAFWTQGPSKLIWFSAGGVVVAVLYWHYAWKRKGAEVVRSLDEHGNPSKYARIGAVLWWESFLILFIVAGMLILSQKLTGWPPHA